MEWKRIILSPKDFQLKCLYVGAKLFSMFSKVNLNVTGVLKENYFKKKTTTTAVHTVTFVKHAAFDIISYKLM